MVPWWQKMRPCLLLQLKPRPRGDPVDDHENTQNKSATFVFGFGGMLFCYFFVFSALTLLVVRQEEHPACKKVE